MMHNVQNLLSLLLAFLILNEGLPWVADSFKKSHNKTRLFGLAVGAVAVFAVVIPAKIWQWSHEAEWRADIAAAQANDASPPPAISK